MPSNDSMSRLLRLSEASELLGITPQTIRAWDREGKIQVTRSAGGHRLVSLAEIERLRGIKAQSRTVTLVYARCSTQKQAENLDRQVGRLLEYVVAKAWKAELFKDIGSGLNENRKAFKKMLQRIAEPDVQRIVVEYKDRLCRYGFSIFEEYCKGFGVEVLVLNQSPAVEFEQELAEDMIALVTSYSARLYGRRGGKKERSCVQ